MRDLIKAGLVALVLSLCLAAPVAAGPYEDGTAAYERGDYATALKLFLGLGNTPVHSEPKQTDLCEVREFVQSLYADPPSPPKPLNGPIKGCIKGDAIHFHIDAAKFPYAEIVSRFCDLTKTVVVEQFKNYTHVVCSYDWKWAKHVTRTVHPDSK